MKRVYQRLDVKVSGISEYITSIVDVKVPQDYCRTNGDQVVQQ